MRGQRPPKKPALALRLTPSGTDALDPNLRRRSVIRQSAAAEEAALGTEGAPFGDGWLELALAQVGPFS